MIPYSPSGLDRLYSIFGLDRICVWRSFLRLPSLVTAWSSQLYIYLALFYLILDEWELGGRAVRKSIWNSKRMCPMLTRSTWCLALIACYVGLTTWDPFLRHALSRFVRSRLTMPNGSGVVNGFMVRGSTMLHFGLEHESEIARTIRFWTILRFSYSKYPSAPLFVTHLS